MFYLYIDPVLVLVLVLVVVVVAASWSSGARFRVRGEAHGRDGVPDALRARVPVGRRGRGARVEVVEEGGGAGRRAVRA